jgi:2-hydroxychromene-2-carboxylate isomerase
MKHITFYLDFISPYAYLAFEKLPEALMGLSYTVRYKPVLLGALLQHHGQLGPAEIAAKRDWTYRHVEWLGHNQRVELQMPALHPFNPLPLLRLSVACAHLNAGEPNRHVCETLFHHVWRGGADALDAARLAALDERLPAHADPQSAAVKAQLKQHTDAAISAGVFGVPAFGVDDKVFWGFDALPMLRDYLAGDAWFDGPSWDKPAQILASILRKR